MNQSVQERQSLLKKALTGNVVFSVVSGVTILFANRALVKFLGLPEKVSLAILGVSLIVYAVMLWLNAHCPKIKSPTPGSRSSWMLSGSCATMR